MALNECGAVLGSLSGGCIEDDLIYRYRQTSSPSDASKQTLFDGPSERVRYSVSADEAHRFGMP